MGAGGVLSGCALPFVGPLVFTDILTGASLLSSAATGKGVTEIALDFMTGKDCRLLEGALREDREFCEEHGSPATEDDFKGLVAWLEDNEPEAPLPGDQNDATIMVAEIGPPDAARDGFIPVSAAREAAQPALFTLRGPVALASLTELPQAWIIQASADYGPDAAGFAAIAPASGAPDLADLKTGDASLPFLPNGHSKPNLADWALENFSPGLPGVAGKAFTMPAPNEKTPDANAVHWNIPWPAMDIVNPAPQQDFVPRPAPAKPRHAGEAATLASASAPFLPAPAKPVLRASLPNRLENARVEFDFTPPAG